MTLPLRALLVVAMAPFVVLGLGAGLWWQADSEAAHAAAVQARLSHALSRPAPAPEAEAMALLVPGETVGLAGSAFQALVLAAVQPTGAGVVEVAAGPADAAAPLTRLHLALSLTATEPQLAAVVLALEGAVPLITVDRLDVQADGAGLSARLALSAWAGKVVP
jgi:hypothetical protein